MNARCRHSRILARAIRALALLMSLSLALAPACAYAGPQVIAPNGQLISLASGKGVILRLDRPAGNIFVADPKIADIEVKSPTIIYLVGKAAGTTTLFALDKEDHVLINSPIEVHADAVDLQRALNQLVPGTKVAVRPVDNSIVLEGPVKSPAEGEDIRQIAARYVPDPKQLVNNMQLVAPNQVSLHVRVAEISRSVEKQFGIDWQNAYNNGAVAFGLVTAGTSVIANSTVTRLIPALPGSTVNGFNTQATAIQGGATVNNIFGGGRIGSKSINGLVTALENQGLITILAEPNLTAVSGQKASFLAGGEFPVPVPQSGTGGSAVVTIDYKKFGVSLSFVATIINNGRISLHVEPEVSQIDNSTAIQVAGVSVPGLSTRRAETTVELGSGQTFAIGGLIQNNVTQNLNKFPWLGDIPILGQLFRSEAFQRNESELVILVTPYVVNPVNGPMATPNDGLQMPTDADMIFNGQMNRPQTQPPGMPAPAAAAAVTTLPDGRKAAMPMGQIGFELD
ncbi:MAG: type II and III secretion system protein family protein [Alphaproteobacteria bacterium]|nr:type II and III secretion system protein family protein [Alphaproteobacteria bacterium]